MNKDSSGCNLSGNGDVPDEINGGGEANGEEEVGYEQEI